MTQSCVPWEDAGKGQTEGDVFAEGLGLCISGRAPGPPHDSCFHSHPSPMATARRDRPVIVVGACSSTISILLAIECGINDAENG